MNMTIKIAEAFDESKGIFDSTYKRLKDIHSALNSGKLNPDQFIYHLMMLQNLASVYIDCSVRLAKALKDIEG